MFRYELNQNPSKSGFNIISITRMSILRHNTINMGSIFSFHKSFIFNVLIIVSNKILPLIKKNIYSFIINHNNCY